MIRLPFALLCGLLMAAGQGHADEVAARPAIILQLPSSMSVDDVARLTEELRAKGAVLAPTSAPPPATAESPIAWRVATRISRALPSLHHLGEMGERWRQAGGEESGPYFWPRLSALFLAALLVEAVLRRGLPHFFPRLRPETGNTLPMAVCRHFLALSFGLAGFLLILRGGAVLLSGGGGLPGEVAERVSIAGGNWRISIAVLSLMTAPRAAAARLLRIDEPGARQVTLWVSPYLFLAMILAVSIWLIQRLGDADLAIALGFIIGLFLLLFKIAMFLTLRTRIAAAILAAGGDAPAWFRRLAAKSWHWLFIGLSIFIFCLALEEFSIGNNPRAALGATALQTALVGMALAWSAKQRILGAMRQEGRGRWWLPALNRAADMAVLLGGSFWLARIWGYDLFDAPSGSATATILRPLFKAAAALLGSWLAWSLIDGLLGDRMAPAQNADKTRLATLLPLIRNSLAIAIFFLGGILALGDLGVDIGPFLAGAGVVGIALGFGAQALVRDVIAGLFFLIDDAFRLGEVIDTGRLKGTVEAISIRSVRLRHQSGQIHTVPFGLIQAVTNSSRDWAVADFTLHVAPNSDLQQIQDILQQIGAKLLGDSEIGGDFIQPLQMQGVVDISQMGVQIRCKFTSRPGRQSRLQHRALHEIILGFAAAGIAFATPHVNSPSLVGNTQ